MGNYNCKECVQRDINNISELVINNKLTSSKTNQDDTYNIKDEKLKETNPNDPEKENENNNINNVETDVSIRRKALLKKTKKSEESNYNNSLRLKKEERENNDLLKNEITQPNDIEMNRNKNNDLFQSITNNENLTNNEYKSPLSNELIQMMKMYQKINLLNYKMSNF